MTREWDDFDVERVDLSGSTEETQQTQDAHDWALHKAAVQWGVDGFEYAGGSNFNRAGGYVPGGSRLRIKAPEGYIVEVRGQFPSHGKQGADPAALAELREMERPVLVLFWESRKTVFTHWLQDDGPEVVNIDNDTTHRRQGWWRQDMTRHSPDAFRFPGEVPNFETRSLF